MKIYATIVAIILQAAGWLALVWAGFVGYRQMSGTAGWLASYSGVGAFRVLIPTGIAAVGLILLALGVLVLLNARRN